MDQEVAKTLGELELKLQQLEHELTAIGPRDAPPGHSGEPLDAPPGSHRPADASTGPNAPVGAPDASHAATAPSQPPGRLVDEAMEPSQAAEALAEGDGFDGPPVFGGEEVPAQPAATGQDWKVDVRETAYGEIPSEGPPAPSLGLTAYGEISSESPPSPSFGPVADRPGPPIPPPRPTPQPPPTAPPGPPPSEHPPAPTPQPDPQPIDRAELVRFKQRLERTMAELSDELVRLLLPKPPT